MIKRRRISICDNPASALRSNGFNGLTVPAKVPFTPATSPVSRACDQVKLASTEKPWEIRRRTVTTIPLYQELITLLPSSSTPTAGFGRGTAPEKNGRVNWLTTAFALLSTTKVRVESGCGRLASKNTGRRRPRAPTKPTEKLNFPGSSLSIPRSYSCTSGFTKSCDRASTTEALEAAVGQVVRKACKLLNFAVGVGPP